MRFLRIVTVVVCCSLLMASSSATSTTTGPRPTTKIAKLENLSQEYLQRFQALRGPEYMRLVNNPRPAQKALNEAPGIQLMFVDERGRPVYYEATNLIAAQTTGTNAVWPGGIGGYSLTGSGTALGELGIWDAGGVTSYHQEFGGRVVQIDTPSSYSIHSTHVAGTMIASGLADTARGMSYEAMLAAYDWITDQAEMAAAAGAGMTVSNHSYATVNGWRPNGEWYWFGDTDVSTTEDYSFGFYDAFVQAWDNIAYNAPYYTICKAAANDRDDAGPGPGEGHWVWDNVLEDWVWSMDTRDPDGGLDGYDCIPPKGCAKNIITVGAVDDIPNGYSSPADVVMTAFSSWGPTDDGRIKPDIVANGVKLFSSTQDTSQYHAYSGTSTATPNVSGSLNLLVRYFEDTHGGSQPLSSTIKALIIETADEAGADPGPDYSHGWGLLNTLDAAELISADAAVPFRIYEGSLENTVNESDTLYLYSSGADPIRLTLAWTDPPGTPPAVSLNPTTPMLVNDLDVRLEHLETSTVYSPYVLNPAVPSAPATTGDNVLDNVEQIYVASPPAGVYMVTVTFKGTLWTGAPDQWYSLVASERLSFNQPSVPLPTLGLWALVLLGVLLTVASLFLIRRARPCVTSARAD